MCVSSRHLLVVTVNTRDLPVCSHLRTTHSQAKGRAGGGGGGGGGGGDVET
jgi:hypothetical protein